jgi:hypothetical protein
MTTPQPYNRPPAAAPLAENVTRQRQEQDSCLQHIAEMALRLSEFGTPEHMHRVGSLRGVVDVGGRMVPFEEDLPFLLPGVGEGHTSLEDTDENIEVARALLLQMLASAPPGAVKIDVYNPQFSEALNEFAHLPPSHFKAVGAGGLKGMLDEYAQHITALRNSHSVVGTPANPWRVMVIAGDSNELDQRTKDQLDQIIASGTDWGSIIAVGPDLNDSPWLRKGYPRGIVVEPDAPLGSEVIELETQALAKQAKEIKSTPLAEVLPPREIWTGSAINGIDLTIGALDGLPYTLTLGDTNTNLLVTGAIGSGKTITIKTMIVSGTEKYSPDELEVYLLDFKEGAEFAGMGPTIDDESYNPNVALVGSNVNDDPEFGIETLRHIVREFKRRANMGRPHNIARYDELRAKFPEERLPRLLVGIDEFQELVGHPEFGREAVELLETIARRGRSFGIHTLLASQSLSGIQSLFVKQDAIFTNFRVRIAGTGGTMLNSTNNVVDSVPQLHLVVNTNAGLPGGEQIIRTTGAYQPVVTERQKRLHKHRRATDLPPKNFDAAKIPKLTEAVDFTRLKPRRTDPSLIVADEYKVTGGSARFKLTRQAGRNLAVVGSNVREVASVMNTTVRSLVPQLPPDTGRISLVCLDAAHAETIEAMATELMEQGRNVEVIRDSNARNFFANTRASLDPDAEESHYVFVYGGDSDRIARKPVRRTEVDIPEGREVKTSGDIRVGGSLSSSMEFSKPAINSPVAGSIAGQSEDGKKLYIDTPLSSGREELAGLIAEGPQNGVHIIGSFTSPTRLRDTLGGIAAKTDGIGGYISFGVPDTEMSSFAGGTISMGRNTVQPWRGRFMDRTTGGAANRRTVIAYDDPAVVVESDDDDF